MTKLPARDSDARARRLRRVIHRAFRLMHDWLRGLGILDFNPRDIDGVLPDGPCVLVANHRTLTDVTSIVAALGPMTAVVKSEIYRLWWLRPLLEGAGLIEGPTGNQLNVATVIDASVRQAANGSRLVFFPEGTRAPDDHLLPFGRTAFEIACRADVPVVPVLLHWKHAWLSKDCRLLEMPDGPTQLHLEVLSPVCPSEVQGSSRALRDMVEATFLNHLELDSAEHLEGPSGRSNRESTQATHRRVADAGGRSSG
jgi:1-acyl-sn-glycerol-3-phosphate acyltransferase